MGCVNKRTYLDVLRERQTDGGIEELAAIEHIVQLLYTQILRCAVAELYIPADAVAKRNHNDC